jgi:hypothetical protein
MPSTRGSGALWLPLLVRARARVRRALELALVVRSDRRLVCVAAHDRIQAIAKAETVSGNAARLGRSVHLCLCKTPGQDRLAALLLLVREGSQPGRRWRYRNAPEPVASGLPTAWVRRAGLPRA